MPRWIRRIPLVLFVLAVLAGIVYAFRPQPVEVDVAPVTRGLLQVTIVDDGRTRVEEPYTVSAPLGGRLLRIELEPGDPVVEGETVLATIEPTDPDLLNERELAEAQARVNAAQAAVRRSQAALERAREELQSAESEYARVRDLAGQNAATRRQVEQAELAFRTRTEDYRAATFSLEIAEYELELARAALRRTLPDADAAGPTNGSAEPWQFPIRSPISGNVLRVFQESMTIVTPGTRLVEVGDPRELELEIDVLSTDAVRISPGDRVIVEHWGGEAPLEGRVKRVEPSAFTKISALGVEEQRVNVIAELVTPPEQRPTLGDAFRIEARIVIWENPDVLKVPTSALFRRGNDWAVFVVRDGQARLQSVEIGRTSGLEAEVLEGLKPGDSVVLHASDRVEDGVVVRQAAEGR